MKQKNAKYELGPLPWDTEVLRKAYFRRSFDIRNAIQKHPGYSAHADLLNLRLSLDVFTDSVADLFRSIETFNIESQKSNFWTRPKRDQFNKRELAIRRGVFSATTSACALKEHSCIINDRLDIPGYQERITRTFANNEEHNFILSLRVCLSHVRIIEADWLQTWAGSIRQTKFLLQRDKLLTWSKWNPVAKSYINKHPKGIDLEMLFKKYQVCVEEFHAWFHSEIQRMAEPELSEYREYERKINGFATKTEWNMLLTQVVIARKIDPYQYLDRHLTDSEIAEVFSLPMRSRKQVDKIIEIVDDYKACDDELRKVVYRAFGVSG